MADRYRVRLPAQINSANYRSRGYVNHFEVAGRVRMAGTGIDRDQGIVARYRHGSRFSAHFKDAGRLGLRRIDNVNEAEFPGYAIGVDKQSPIFRGVNNLRD